MKAIVLAAGKGTRLLPITTYRPKHLLEIAGKSILKRLIDSLLEHELIDDIVIVIHYYSDIITNKINTWYSTKDLSRISFVTQKETLGTGDAVATAIKERNIQEDFLVVYGDLIIGNSINKMLEDYSKNPNQGYILGAKVKIPEKYGVLIIEENKFVSIIEKPKNAPHNALINAGVYIFPKNAVQLIVNLSPSARNEIELTDLIHFLVKAGNNIQVIESNGNWFDIGYPWEILNANEKLLGEEIDEFNQHGIIEENVTLKGDVHISKGARIRSGTYIEGPVYIDEEADVGPNCYIRGATYIGKKVRIGNACEIKNSVIYANTHAAHLSYVGDSVLGQHCNLGAGTITANLRHDKANVKVSVKDLRIDSGRRKLGVILGDNVKTGISVSLLPGIKIDADIWINAGIVVSKDQKKS
ncbi:MAG: NTP transferase domain-containing protein [Candidatus Heimdallarchaeota archaeon]|nr:NTP transferase domain-containing protein [Candidatus Heimdallarchaeota archaeon]